MTPQSKICFKSNSKIFWKNLMPVAFLAASAVVCAQSYPSKSVTLVVPFAPGGSVDQAGRLIADPLSRLLGQPFVVENRGGAAGTIAHAAMARAPKDGYSILVAYSTTNACSPALYPKLSWDPVKDFTPVGMMAVSPLVLVIHPSVPARTLNELLDHVKKHPGELNYGSSGVGSQAHIAGEMFQQRTETKMVHVPFKGSGDLMPSLLNGTIQMAFATTSAVLQQVQAGRLKVLAVAGMTRDSTMPEVPTVNESGVSGFDVEGWVGLFVPTGTPSQVTARLTDALQRATANTEFRQRVKTAGLETQFLATDAVAAKVRKDIEECTTTIRNAGIKLE